MLEKCIICGKRSVEGVILFKFPINEKRKKEWLEAINVNSVKSNDRVCGLHFPADCFKYRNKRRLKEYACPDTTIQK